MPKDDKQYRAIEGELSARGFRFGIVVSRFNSVITNRLLDGAVDSLRRTGADPGASPVSRADPRTVSV